VSNRFFQNFLTQCRTREIPGPASRQLLKKPPNPVKQIFLRKFCSTSSPALPNSCELFDPDERGGASIETTNPRQPTLFRNFRRTEVLQKQQKRSFPKAKGRRQSSCPSRLRPRNLAIQRWKCKSKPSFPSSEACPPRRGAASRQPPAPPQPNFVRPRPLAVSGSVHGIAWMRPSPHQAEPLAHPAMQPP